MVDQSNEGMSFGTKVLLGVLAGIACGVMFGEMVGWLRVVGDVYINLLQMTVLPYVAVSLVLKIGGMTMDQARRMSGRAGLVLLGLWAVSLVAVVALPQSLPEWSAGTFFSPALVEDPPVLDLIGLYVPTNPFNALSGNVVPAVVVFSIFVGGALIGVADKDRLLKPLAVASDTLGQISGFVTKLTPYGTFALTAVAAGTLAPSELARISGYVSTFTLGVALLSLVVLPGLTTAFTRIGYWELMGSLRSSILTAFATGKLFAVLQIIMNDVQQLLERQGISPEEARATADLFVPLGYPFPNAGKILGLLFLPFAGWFVGQPLEWSDYGVLVTVGVCAFFGSPVAAIPFLLGLLELPMDTFPLFLVAGIWCARLGDVLGAVHLSVFTFICSAWNHGALQLRPIRLLWWVALSAVLLVAGMSGNHAVVAWTIQDEKPISETVGEMDFQVPRAEVVEEAAGPNPEPLRDGETRVERFRRTGRLRVGFVSDQPPFCYRNNAGKVVGMEVDLLQHFAYELKTTLVLVPTSYEGLADDFAADHFDVALGKLDLKIREFEHYFYTQPYIEAHAALLVPDHMAKATKSLQILDEFDEFRIGVIPEGLFVDAGRFQFANISRVEVESVEAFMAEDADLADALLTSAESGSILAMLNPEYSVVVPDGVRIGIPLAFAVQREPGLWAVINELIVIKRAQGVIGDLQEHWIFGKQAHKHDHRWSIVRDVLGWVE